MSPKPNKVGIYLGAEPSGGGTFQYNQTILDALDALPNEKYEKVVIYSHVNWEKYLKAYDIESHHIEDALPISKLRKLWVTYRLSVLFWRLFIDLFDSLSTGFKKLNCDIWVFPSQDTISYLAGVPALSSIHDLMHRYEFRFPEVSENGKYHQREYHYKNICKWSRGLFVDSDTGKSQVIDSYDTAPSRIFVLPFVAPKYISMSNLTEIEFVKFPLPDKFIFYPAQFWEHKNHAKLISAINLLKNDIPEIQLLLVGGKQNAYYEIVKLIEKLELKQNVSIHDYVEDEDMPILYKRARALVMPTYFGPTNIPPLEAFNTGCPVAVSDIYGMKDQTDGAALLFDPNSVKEIANAIQKLWLDDGECESLSLKGRQVLESWNQGTFNKKFYESISAVLLKKDK